MTYALITCPSSSISTIHLHLRVQVILLLSLEEQCYLHPILCFLVVVVVVAAAAVKFGGTNDYSHF